MTTEKLPRSPFETGFHFIDFVSTVLDLARIEKSNCRKGEPIPPTPGKSLAPALAEDVAIPRDSLWWLHDDHRAIRVGDWKLVAPAKEPWELYDLKADRAEQTNLAAKMPEKVKEMSELWQKQTDAFISAVRNPPARGEDE